MPSGERGSAITPRFVQQSRFQRKQAKVKLLIIDDLGLVPLSKTGAELLFELDPPPKPPAY